MGKTFFAIRFTESPASLEPDRAQLDASPWGLRPLRGPALFPKNPFVRTVAMTVVSFLDQKPSTLAGIEATVNFQGAASKDRETNGLRVPCRQLPDFRRLAYPVHDEATTRVLLGRKIHGRPW